MFGNKKKELFFLVGDQQKNYYPISNTTEPVELRMKLSKKAHVYSYSTYMLTDWLIDMGGISKALYFGGLIIAHFVALRLYKAALMQDIYLVQNKSVVEEETEAKRRKNFLSKSQRIE